MNLKHYQKKLEESTDPEERSRIQREINRIRLANEQWTRMVAKHFRKCEERGETDYHNKPFITETGDFCTPITLNITLPPVNIDDTPKTD